MSVFWATLAIVLVLIGLLSAFKPSVSRLASRAASHQNLDDLVAYIEARPESVRHTAFHQAMGFLWQAYHRPLAITLVRRLAVPLIDAPIVHYWIKQALEIEGDTAAEILDEEFLTSCYRPEIARTCGAYG